MAKTLGGLYCRIHGIYDAAKITRRAPIGCVGLFNRHVETLFALVKVTTPVLLL